jgi:flagellin-like protein
MKGISDIIAMLLMLVITIAIAGLAYGFISGVFTGRTAVVLSIDGASTFCNNTHIVAYVRNDGTATSGTVTVTVYNSTGVVSSANCPGTGIGSGVTVACPVGRDGSGIGTHTITATAAGASTARGTVYCAS